MNSEQIKLTFKNPLEKKISHKNNTLNMTEFYKVTRWIDENKSTLVNHKTQAQIAEAASNATGVKVTVSNIRAVSDALGIHLGLRMSTAKHTTDTTQILAKGLCDLYIRLGEQVPDAIKAMAK